MAVLPAPVFIFIAQQPSNGLETNEKNPQVHKESNPGVEVNDLSKQN